MASGGDKDYRVIVVGSARVGKTSLIQRYCFNEFSYDVPQTASEERKVVRVGEKQVPLVICDLAGMWFRDLVLCDLVGMWFKDLVVCDLVHVGMWWFMCTWLKDL
jgi:hypothetical protein